jgi:adenine-specific DNA-methyltransferase
MIYPRLKVARNLLADDGVVMVSIDENEHANLVNVGIEIFGHDSYVGEIVVKNSSRNDQRYISMQHEYLVFFVKSKADNLGRWIEKKGGLDSIYTAFEGFRKEHGDDWEAIHTAAKAWFKQFAPADPEFASKHYTRMDEVGVYFADNISGPNDGQYEYEVIHPVTGKPCKMPSRGWVYPEESMLEKIEEGRIVFGADETKVPNVKTYLKDTEYQSLPSVRFVDGRAASNRLRDLFGKKVFTNPKDELMLRDIFRAIGVSGEDLVLDLFSGSGTAAHAVLELNRETGSAARFIAIQVAEDLHETLKTARGAAQKTTRNAIELLEGLGSPATVAEIAKQRLRLAGERFDGAEVDAGFRVFKVDETGMADVLRTPGDLGQADLKLFVERVKADRSAEDLLFEVLLDWGLELTMPVAVKDLDGHEVHVVDDGTLIACLEETVDDDLVMSVAKRKPLRALFRDSGFATDADRINAEQTFAEVSSATDVRTI